MKTTSLLLLLTGLAAGLSCISIDGQQNPPNAKKYTTDIPLLNLPKPPKWDLAKRLPHVGKNFCKSSTDAKLSTRQPHLQHTALDRRSIISFDENPEFTEYFRWVLQAAAIIARYAADVAANHVSLVRRYFGEVNEEQHAHVVRGLRQVAEEAAAANAGRLTVVCDGRKKDEDGDGSEDEDETVFEEDGCAVTECTCAYFSANDGRVHITDAGLRHVPQDLVFDQSSWPTAIIHEFTHALLGTQDYRYGRWAPDGLTPDELVDNADTYAHFAQDIYMWTYDRELRVCDMTEEHRKRQYEDAQYSYRLKKMGPTIEELIRRNTELTRKQHELDEKEGELTQRLENDLDERERRTLEEQLAELKQEEAELKEEEEKIEEELMKAQEEMQEITAWKEQEKERKRRERERKRQRNDPDLSYLLSSPDLFQQIDSNRDHQIAACWSGHGASFR